MEKASAVDIHQLFSRTEMWQAWLDVEAALARVQADMGVIPVEAATEISSKAKLSTLDMQALEEDVGRTNAPILSLAKTLAAACEENAGGYVHWGATTQNIMQTGRTLQIRKAHVAFLIELGRVFAALAALAEKGADMTMAGRTQNRHALPITFGFKAAGWIEEFLRHEDRFREMEKRVFSLRFGGAVGAMQSFGDKGPELTDRLASLLDLQPVEVPTRASVDHFVEYILQLALFAGTCTRIVEDMYTLMSEEIDEVSETLDEAVIGSSTMPQKVNSKIAVGILSLAASIRAQVPLALEGMQQRQEGDLSRNTMMSQAVDAACPQAYELVSMMNTLLSGLRLDPDRMRANLDLTGGSIAAENAMMALAPSIGRQAAHDLVHTAAQEASLSGKPLADILWDNKTVQSTIPETILREALNPESYTGYSEQLAHQGAARAKQAAKRLRTH